MKLDQARAIHKKTGQRFKRTDHLYWKREGGIGLYSQSRDDEIEFTIDLSDLDADDWEVEPLPEKSESQKQDEEDLDTLRRILDSYSVTQIVSDPTMRNIYNMASLLKRKFFGVAE